MSAGVTKQFNPATGEPLSSVENTAVDVLPAIVKKAREAQRKVWGPMAFKDRAVYIKRIKSFLAAHAEEGAEIISLCNGKTRQDAMATEILSCVMACDWYAGNTHKVLKPQKLPNGNILFANKTNTLEYSPVGVVGIISPWNYPFSIPFGEVIMGLMAGNAVILKVATPTTLVGKFIEKCINAAQLPEGLFSHVVLSGAQAGPAMLAAGINKLFFTGSVGVGKKLMAEAAQTLTPLSLELGGKDPMVVLADADIERATNCACWAGYQNAGQSCGGVERIYVHKSLYPAFVALLVAKTKALRHGPAGATPGEVDMGCITTQGQLDTIRRQVEEAVAKGAKIVAQSRPTGDCSKGFFFPATVLTDVDHSMTIMREENFGPVLPVMSFETEDEAVSLANDCSMALTASVFSRSGTSAKRVASKIEAGVVSINDHLYSHGQSEAPWGGWKESGLGRTHGYLGLKEMSNVRCINNDLVPSSWIPRNMWWYPFTKESYKGICSGIGFLAPTSAMHFVKAAATLLPFAVKTMFAPWKVPGSAEALNQVPPENRQSGLGKLIVKAAVVVPIVGGILAVKGKAA